MGVNQIDSVFRTQYTDEFKVDFEIEEAMLRKCVHSNGVIMADVVKFDVVSTSEEAVQKGRDGLIPSLQLGLSQVSATLEKWHAPYRIDNFDVFRANPNVRGMMSQKGRAAINRKINQLIIDQLDTATNVVSGTVTSLSSLALVMSWLNPLLTRNVPVGDGKMWGLVTPTVWGQMLRINEFKSSDYIDDKVMSKGPAPQGRPTYQVRHWLGVNWMICNQLTGAGTATSSNYIFHESVLGHMISGDPAPVLFNNEEHDYTGVRFEIMQAAKLCLNNGVQKMVHNDTTSFTG